MPNLWVRGVKLKTDMFFPKTSCNKISRSVITFSFFIQMFGISNYGESFKYQVLCLVNVYQIKNKFCL